MGDEVIVPAVAVVGPAVASPAQPKQASLEHHALIERRTDEETGAACFCKPGDNRWQAWRRTFILTYQTFGIVYGDIGTSPLYTINSVFQSAPSQEDIIGVLSCIIWTLLIVVLFKYVIFVLMADDHGEGGTFALYSMLSNALREALTKALFKRVNTVLAFVAMAGVALVLSDGILTPAISVISAVEGLEVASSSLAAAVLPISICILLGLFLLQSFGTSRVSHIFSPVLLLWFISLGLIGLYNFSQAPEVAAAFSPHHAILYFARKGYEGWVSLGSIVLCVTGAEALFADVGHFSRASIRISASTIVLPCVILCYMGQSAALYVDNSRFVNVFYMTLPSTLFAPMLVLATFAAIIASQAMISASFSLMYQASRLQFFPRMTIKHTDSHNVGQVYLPEINFLLMVGCITVSVIFQHSSNLTFAYGFAVCSVFFITSSLFVCVMHFNFKWHWAFSILFFAVFGFVDAAFLSANLLKFATGGWFPMLLAICFTTVMVIWWWGQRRMAKFQKALSVPDADLFSFDKLRHLDDAVSFNSESSNRPLVNGHGLEAVANNNDDQASDVPFQPIETIACVPDRILLCFSSVPEAIPASFVHFLRCMPVRPHVIIFVHIKQWQMPEVDDSIVVWPLPEHERVYRAHINIGYMQLPPTAPSLACTILRNNIEGLPNDLDAVCASDAELLETLDITYFIGRDDVVPHLKSSFGHVLAVYVFRFLLRMSRSVAVHLGVPVNRLLEVNVRIPI